MNKTLRPIGFWRCNEEFVALPHPKELADRSWRFDDRLEVAEYLRSGARLHVFMGLSYCRFRDGPPDEEMGCAELTDGIWVWPEGLPLYVERYAVRLPEEFCLHAKNQRRVSVTAEQIRALIDAPYSMDDWLDWCRANRSNRLLAALTPIYRRFQRWRASRMLAREKKEPEYEIE